MGEVTAWSYSRYDCYTQCPYKFRLQFLDKLPIEPSEAMARGQRIHNDIAKYLQNPLDFPFPSGFTHKAELISEIAKFDDKAVEQQWGFDRQWQPTGWFAKGKNATWLRTIVDVGLVYGDDTGELVDWKTGKARGGYDDQMKIFGISFLQKVPYVTEVTTRLAFLDNAATEMRTVKRSDLPELIDEWEAKTAPMFEDTEFLPRPNDKCKFCDFRRSNGGPCRYG